MKVMLNRSTTGFWLSIVLMFTGLSSTAAAETDTAMATGTNVVAPSQKMSRAQARQIRKHLDTAPGWRHSTKTIAGGTSHRYISAQGLSLEINIPAKGMTPPPSDYLRAGGCGFLQLCVYFNPSDQRALISGGGAALAGIICAAAPPACPYAAVAIAVAVSYLRDRGICRAPKDELRVRVLPVIGKLACV